MNPKCIYNDCVSEEEDFQTKTLYCCLYVVEHLARFLDKGYFLAAILAFVNILSKFS